MGQNINDLIRDFGYPTRTFTIPNGNTVYEFAKSRTVHVPAYTTSTKVSRDGYGGYNVSGGQTYGGYNLDKTCTLWFECDAEGTILTYRFEGNACKAKP